MESSYHRSDETTILKLSSKRIILSTQAFYERLWCLEINFVDGKFITNDCVFLRCLCWEAEETFSPKILGQKYLATLIKWRRVKPWAYLSRRTLLQENLSLCGNFLHITLRRNEFQNYSLKCQRKREAMNQGFQYLRRFTMAEKKNWRLRNNSQKNSTH